VGWALSVSGDAYCELEDIAIHPPDNLIVSAQSSAGMLKAGTQEFTTAERSELLLGVSRATGATPWSLAIKSNQRADSSRLAVAPDTSFVHGFLYQGVVETSAEISAAGVQFRGYSPAHVSRFTEPFTPYGNGLGSPHVQDLDAIVAEIGATYVLFPFEQGITYPTNGAPYYGTVTEDRDDCVTSLAKLSQSGTPSWLKSYDWCTDSYRSKAMRLSTNGDLYLAGAGCSGAGCVGSAPPKLGDTTLSSIQSGLIARVSSSNGDVKKVLEFAAASYGRVDDIGFLSDGTLIALVTAQSAIRIGSQLAPAGAYFVRLSPALEVQGFAGLGSPVGAGARLFELKLAVAPNDNLYITGSFRGDYEIGGASMTYKGTCERCIEADAFAASFTPKFEHRWTRHLASVSEDHGNAIVAENGRAYVAITHGDTIMLGGKPYITSGRYMSGTVFAFVE
jgi:hypothetical protein